MSDNGDSSKQSSRINIDESARPSYPLEKMRGRQSSRRRARAEAIHKKSGRVPPQAVDVEKAVLGAMLIEEEAIPQAIEVLPPDAFYDSKHQDIYVAILSLFERDNPVDLVTLTEELKRRDQLEDVGGAYYLTDLTTEVASAANVEYHARIIAEKSLLRKLIETMTEMVGEAYEPGTDAFELLDEAESSIFKISDSQLRNSSKALSGVVKDTLERLEEIHEQDGNITGVPSGFPKLDEKTSGFQPSDLIIIAARPSMGKTAFALACSLNAATHSEMPTGVAIFSLEMGARQLAQRLLTSEARVDAQRARTGNLKDEDWRRLARAAGTLNEADIYIDDTPALSVLELRAKCRRLKAEHDIGLVVVDYLQLMQASSGLRERANREQEIAHISRSLKGLAKELDLPVIALSQLNRGVENRGGDKRPQLADLRESGCLVGDTLIPLADTGERVPIQELCGNAGFRVWAVDPETHKIKPKTVTNAFCTGKKPVYRLQTQLGCEIRATGNHKFLTVNGWRRLDELTEGDRIALPRSLESRDAKDLTDPELELLGFLIGDGCGLQEKGMSNRQMQKSIGVSYCGTSLYKSNLSRERALRVAERVSSERLHALATSDIYWDKVASIEPDGTENVYDLTVPELENFVANDIIVHNSIEQDADVVAFIYRAERYGITVDDQGNSTEGIAEIIIGKQRNGPIGNVKLAFVDQYARFENLTTRYDDAPGDFEEGGSAGGFGSGGFGGGAGGPAPMGPSGGTFGGGPAGPDAPGPSPEDPSGDDAEDGAPF